MLLLRTSHLSMTLSDLSWEDVSRPVYPHRPKLSFGSCTCRILECHGCLPPRTSWSWPEPWASAGPHGGTDTIAMDCVASRAQLCSTWWQSKDVKITTHSVALSMVSGQTFITGASGGS